MAEDCDLAPSLDNVFDILSRVPKERLLSLWYKFNPDNSNASKVHSLLYSIISFFLRKEKEAEIAVRSVLNERPADRSTLYIYNRIQGLADAADGEEKPPENSNEDLSAEGRSFLADLAFMFIVLVEENLCSPSVRDRACRAAVKAFKSNKQDCSVERQELVEKFRLRFGFLDFEGEEENAGISALKSIKEPNQSKVTTMAFRTDPMTIPSQITINSHGTSEMTLPSHFEISASPTASFTTNLSPNDLESSIVNAEDCTINSADFTTVGANNDNIPSSDSCLGRGRVTPSIGGHRREEQAPASLGSAEGSSGDKVNEARPSESTGKKDSDQIVTSKSKMSEGWSTGTGDFTNSISHNPSQEVTKPEASDQSSSSDNTSDKPSPSGETPEAMVESFEDTFYPFVVLHVPEDIEIAEHVRDKLESLGVKGTTIDDISVPGQSPIRCIEDAVNNSAFTILLLTKNFNTRWADYEANVTLMHSINNKHKYNTVVPLLPKQNPLQKDKIPFAFHAIISLNENSRYFEKHVKNIFTKTVLENHRRVWLQQQRQKQIQSKANQIKKDIQVTQETLSNQIRYMQLYNQLAEMQKHCQLVQLPPLPHPGNVQDQPVLNPPLYSNFSTPFNLPIPPVSLNAPHSNPVTPSASQFASPSNSQGGQNVTVGHPMQTSGQGTNIIQIHHAKNVQIGDSNQMTITECMASRESTDDEEEEDSHRNTYI
ncbi:TIR domain-containing adapter molecule 1 [Pristis pectinata]|uniref:TIR domain-containing adapter molecule 1 n=1 Tax=Pristis pectinata TaxID=685728 RepID=UPI00223E6AC2|nr:TIR domain-containing adapter molecule 1 [Pristis pectinata]XP_051894304.1 TIR domain-containing adapter molecule 1 [Pristis pectinata]